MKTTRLVATAVVVLAVLIVSFSQASAQTMYACVNNKTGAMRYVTGPGLCAKNETQVSWNVTGPQGAQGPAGPAGPTGPQGPAAGVKVYDADDNYLCDLIGINDEWWDHIANSPKFQFQFLTCFIPSLQSFMSIDRFVGSDRLVAPVFFELPDSGNHDGCTSSEQPWVEQRFANMVFRDGLGNYYKTTNVTAELKSMGSVTDPETGSCNGRWSELPPLLVVPAERIASPFAFPVALPLIFK